MASQPSFIKLNTALLVLHGLQQKLRLFLAHLSLFLRFGFGKLSRLLLGIRRLVAVRVLNFPGQFFLRRSDRRRRWRSVFILAFAGRRRRCLFFATARSWRFFRLLLLSG